MEVAGEMPIDVFHRHDLRVTAARRAALHPEYRAQAGSRRQMIVFLPILLSASPSLTVVVVLPSPAGVGLKAVTRISLPFVGFVLQAVDVIEVDLGLEVAIGFNACRGDAEAGGDLSDRLQGGALGDLYVGTHGYSQY